jgi:hypothetical protein
MKSTSTSRVVRRERCSSPASVDHHALVGAGDAVDDRAASSWPRSSSPEPPGGHGQQIDAFSLDEAGVDP